MILKYILDFILILPKLWSVFNQIKESVKEWQKKQMELRYAEAWNKLKNAKTEQEKKDAFKNLSDLSKP